MSTSPLTSEYLAAPNRVVSAVNRIDYAYRRVGEGTPALVLLQHFRGNLDNWDPALVDALTRERAVVTFDNAGVGGSTGATTRKPAAASGAICSRQPYQNSGKPCSRTISGPSPAST